MGTEEATDWSAPNRAMDEKYDECSAAQRGIQEANEAKVATAVRQVALRKSDACFSVLLVGCATGLNDLLLVQRVVVPLVAERYGQEFPVQIICADVMENGWAQVFKNAQQVFQKQANVFVSAVGGSYTEQYVRDDSIHLVLTFSCLHWFDELPESAVSCKSFCFVGFDESEVAKQDLRKLSDKMLNQFLAARFKELAPGGHLIATFDAETDSIPLHNFGGSTLCVQRAINNLIDKGDLHPDLLKGYFIKTASRTEAQIRGCLKTVDCEIQALAFFNAACPYFEEYSKIHGDNQRFGRDIANAMRSCLAQELARCLTVNGCNRVDAMVDKIFETCESVAGIKDEDGAQQKYSTMGAVCTMWVSAKSPEETSM